MPEPDRHPAPDLSTLDGTARSAYHPGAQRIVTNGVWGGWSGAV